MGVYAIACGKGGIGKTTTVVNTGLALQEAGYQVGLVDADLSMGNLGGMLDVEPETGIHDVLADEASINDVAVRGPEGMVIVPGNADLAAVGAADPSRLNRVLDPLAEACDVVLVDTGAGVGHEHLVAFGRADGVIVATTPTAAAIDNAGKTLEVADRVDATVVGGVLTRVTDAGKQVERVGEALSLDVLAAIPEAETVADSPLVDLDAAGPAAEAYDRFGAALSIHAQVQDEHAGEGGDDTWGEAVWDDDGTAEVADDGTAQAADDEGVAAAIAEGESEGAPVDEGSASTPADDGGAIATDEAGDGTASAAKTDGSETDGDDGDSGDDEDGGLLSRFSLAG
jgi:septum site-determining protein MinD